jgi:nitrite reductase/ring-hydroxylating ferredoxin subunit
MPETEFPVGRHLDRVAVIERSIGASIERVWENVLDWEHLPWLHGRDFASIELDEQADWGWRAKASSRRRPDDFYVIELRIDREAGRYVTRTLSGTGAGSEIWTALEVASTDLTRIRVEFWLPGVPEARRARIGAGYVHLYQRLWDEDESMMRERAACLTERSAVRSPRTPTTVALGTRTELIAQLPKRVDAADSTWRIVMWKGEPLIHDARCPHAFGPLYACSPDAEGELVCPWHGYRFDVRTGESRDGRRLRLRKPPRLEHDPITDQVVLVVD